MRQTLWQAFSLVCGQNPEHTWDLGQGLLPLCQRCAGLYVGGCVCLALHWALRPRYGARFVALHGLFLLIAAPFGLHWIPHGPVLRVLTGLLCGYGIATFLWRVPATAWGFTNAGARKGAESWYVLGLCAALLLVPSAAKFGGVFSGWALQGLAAAGAVAFAGLVAANLVLGLRGLAPLQEGK